NTRSAAYSKGRNTACRKMLPRRSHRSEKLCAFQAKKATGRTVLRFSRLPSTRQYTGALWPLLSVSDVNTRSRPKPRGTAYIGHKLLFYSKDCVFHAETKKAAGGLPAAQKGHAYLVAVYLFPNFFLGFLFGLRLRQGVQRNE